MTSVVEQVGSHFERAVNAAFRANREGVEQAGRLMAECYRRGGTIWAFGSGHSHLLVEEMFFRAGTPVLVHPLWDPRLMLHEGPRRSSQLERLRGYYRRVLDGTNWQASDLLWIISNSGRNWVVVELAEAARRKGLHIIALTSLTHSREVQPLEPHVAKLFERADVILDNGGPVGDAGFDLPGVALPIAPTSTVVGAALVHAALAVALERLRDDAGAMPPILASNNVD